MPHRSLGLQQVGADARAAQTGQDVPVSVMDTVRSDGCPLDFDSRAFFEPRFGFDFSRVRIHTDARAASSATQIDARAYTMGNHIVFASDANRGNVNVDRALLAHELAHVMQQHASPAVTLQRAPKGAGAPTPDTSAGNDLALLESVWSQLGEFQNRAVGQLKSVGLQIQAFLDNYDSAYSMVTTTLAAAKEDAVPDAKWATALGIVIGVGVGLASGGIYTAASLAGKVLVELAGEGAEAAAADVLDSPDSTVDYALKPEAQKDAVARKHERELRRAWEGVALLGAAAFGFGPRRDKLRGGPTVPPVPMTAEDRARLKSLESGLAAVDRALRVFVGTFDTPVLKRSARQLERDLWIRWVSESKAHADAASGDTPIAKRMLQLNAWQDLGLTRQSSIVDAAKRRVAGLNEIGLVGVVVLPPAQASDSRKEHFGVVHVRPDAYEKLGRQQPASATSDQYVKILWRAGEYLRTGEVVTVTDHGRSVRGGEIVGAIAKREKGELAVASSEVTKAFGLSEMPPQSWYSNAKGEPLDENFSHRPGGSTLRAGGLVHSVVYGARTADATLIVSESEEGALVSDAVGAALVLFTAYVSFQDAERARARVRAMRVVAVDLTPGSQISDFGDAHVLVTRTIDEQVVVREILSVRPPAPGSKGFIGPVDTGPAPIR